MAIEIVSFLINSMVIFHSYVNVYQRVTIDPCQCNHDVQYHPLLCLDTPLSRKDNH